MSESVNSAALVHLSLTEDEREALEGHRTLVLTSSQALPDCALNCSSFFLNDTLFAVARLYATDEIISLQFPCVNSALINLDSGKPSKCHVCFYDFVLLLVYCHCSNVTSCCIVECSASLAQAIYLLSLLHKGRAQEICAQLSDRRASNMWTHGAPRAHGGTSKGQVLRAAFQFQKNSYLSHLS